MNKLGTGGGNNKLVNSQRSEQAHEEKDHLPVVLTSWVNQPHLRKNKLIVAVATTLAS